MQEKNNLRKLFYLKLMRVFTHNSLDPNIRLSIFGIDDEYFIIDEKYEKLINKIINKYYKKQNLSLKQKVFSFLIAINLLITTLTNSEEITSLAAEELTSLTTYLTKGSITYDTSSILPNATFASAVENTDISSDDNMEALNEEYKELKRIEEYENYLKEYAKYFNFDEDKVIYIANQVTNNYRDFSKVLDEKRYNLSNPEAACMLFVYFLDKNAEKHLNISLNDYGFDSLSDLKTTDEIYIIEPNWMKDHVEDESVEKQDITLRNGLSYSQFVGKMCDLFNISEEHKAYVLAVSYIERGECGSPLSIYSNNMGGLKNRDNEFITIESPEGGIIYFVANLKRYEYDYNITSMEKFGATYDGDEFADKWIKDVSDKYNKIMANYDKYFLSEDKPNKSKKLENKNF